MMCKGHLHLKLLSYVPINIVLIVLGSARLALLGSARLISRVNVGLELIQEYEESLHASAAI